MQKTANGRNVLIRCFLHSLLFFASHASNVTGTPASTSRFDQFPPRTTQRAGHGADHVACVTGTWAPAGHVWGIRRNCPSSGGVTAGVGNNKSAHPVDPHSLRLPQHRGQQRHTNIHSVAHLPEISGARVIVNRVADLVGAR